MPQTLTIGSHEVGSGAPCYLIAEVGTTSLGRIDMALQLIEAAKNAGMDAVKFQVIDPFQDTRRDATYKIVTDGMETQANMRDMFASLSFDRGEWRRIADACRSIDIEFLATCDYLDGVDMLDELEIVAHKIGAWDTTYRTLIEHIGRTGKPMIADLGPTTEEELEELLGWYHDAGGSAVIPLHDFHTDVAAEMNMNAITYLLSKNRGPVGFSSPNRDSDMDLVALALGAQIIEKRLILERSTPAFHAHESMEPDELTAWVRRIRRAEAALGTVGIRPSSNDKAGALQYYRSLATRRPVSKGQVFTTDMVDGKRPGSGIATKYLSTVLGRSATRDIPADTLLSADDFK